MKKKPSLRVYYSKSGGDILYHYENNASKALGGLLAYALETSPVFNDKTFRQELESRGFDITSLRFSIREKTDDKSG